MTNRVLMIGLDGATFSLLRPLSQQGVLPFLTSLIRGGTAAQLMSTRNPLTPPAWTSMTTGRSPEVHGIYDFLRPAYLGDGSVYLKVNDRRDNHCETVFAMVNRHKMRGTALNFYGYAPPPQIDGYVVSGFVPWKHLRHGIHPQSLFDSLKASTDFDYRDLGMDIGEEKKCVQGLHAGEHEEWIELQNVRDRAWTDVTCRLMTEDRTELTAVVLDGPDKIQHLFWRYLDAECHSGEPGEWTDRITQLATDFYRQMDDNIRRMVETAGPDTNVILVSDHGFGPTTEILYINQWLAEKGYLTWTGRAEDDAKGQLTAEKIRDHLGMIDWRKTVAFCPTPSSNAIYIKPDLGNGQGIKPDDYLAFVQNMQAELMELRDASGKQVVVGASPNKLRGRSFVEPCPDITLSLRDGGFVSILPSDTVVKDRVLADGTHRPEGIFIGHGPAFKRGEQLEPLNLLDITPLMLTLLGLPVPRDLEGRVPVEALETGITATTGAATATVAADEGREEVSDEDREILLRQMQKLGYMD
ncbi:alkaline phosphatase family protein [Frigidibacter albus]|nr:alkaline phosphatase family protein [Frigidibacter albus]